MSKARNLAHFVSQVLSFGASQGTGFSLRRERFDLAGLTSKNFTVPAGAKAMRLTAHVKDATNVSNYHVLRVAVGGSILSGTANYNIAGTQTTATSTAVGTIPYQVFDGALCDGNLYNPGTKKTIKANAELDRGSTADFFLIETESAQFHVDANFYRSVYMGVVSNANTGSSLRISEFQFAKVGGGAWAAGSKLLVEWLD